MEHAMSSIFISQVGLVLALAALVVLVVAIERPWNAFSRFEGKVATLVGSAFFLSMHQLATLWTS
jgi:hypothetical protein